jgi:hypothetical protein
MMARLGPVVLVLCGTFALASCGPAPQSHSPHFSQSQSQCLADLGARAANFTPLPDQYYGAGCSALGAVRLHSLTADSQSLALTNLGPVTCPLANAFAGWARFGIDRAARAILGSPLARIETLGSYACRNVAGTDRRSGHATANAIDIAAFVLADGRRITVEQGWTTGTLQERRFLRAVHESACRRFSLVLGPDYDAPHRNHLHVELGKETYCR